LSDRFKDNVTPEGEQADLDQNICRLCLSGGSNVDRYGAGCLCLADDNYTGDYIDGSGCGERLLACSRLLLKLIVQHLRPGP
jgi:hypothetical protein